jgi:hypothetical protein
MRPLEHIQKLDDAFADFLVDVTCLKCGRGSLFRPAELATRVGWQCPLHALAPRLRCTHCGAKGEVRIVARATPRPRGLPKNPH